MPYTVRILNPDKSLSSTRVFPSRGEAARVVIGYPKCYVCRHSESRMYTIHLPSKSS